MEKSRRRSAVWKFYEITKNKDVTCKLCEKTVKRSSNTTNLFKHLRIHHSNQISNENLSDTQTKKCELQQKENDTETEESDDNYDLMEYLSLRIDNHCDTNSNLERDVNSKRVGYLEWDEFFMATAFLAAKRSKDPVSQVGACIVNKDKKIVGTGYNGMPIGCNDDDFPWNKESSSPLENKYLYVCHAEMNAVLNKNSADVKDCTMYVGLFPCNECAKIIIQSGITEVVYMSDKHAHKVETIAAKTMFNSAGVKYRQFIPNNDEIIINFSGINWNQQRQVQPTPKKKFASMKNSFIKQKQSPQTTILDLNFVDVKEPEDSS